jgi:hypothetical protein
MCPAARKAKARPSPLLHQSAIDETSSGESYEGPSISCHEVAK